MMSGAVSSLGRISNDRAHSPTSLPRSASTFFIHWQYLQHRPDPTLRNSSSFLKIRISAYGSRIALLARIETASPWRLPTRGGCDFATLRIEFAHDVHEQLSLLDGVLDRDVRVLGGRSPVSRQARFRGRAVARPHRHVTTQTLKGTLQCRHIYQPDGAAGQVEHQFLNTGLAVHAAVTPRRLGPERSFVSGMRPCVIHTLPSPQNPVRFTTSR